MLAPVRLLVDDDRSPSERADEVVVDRDEAERRGPVAIGERERLALPVVIDPEEEDGGGRPLARELVERPGGDRAGVDEPRVRDDRRATAARARAPTLREPAGPPRR